MAIAKKRAPKVASPELSRAVQQVYDDINDLINSVNQSLKETRSASSGKPGDIRVIKDLGNNTYKLEAFTEDGWAETTLEITKE